MRAYRILGAVLVPDEDFAIRVNAGRLTVDPGRNSDPQCVITGDQMALLPVLYAGLSVSEAVEAGMLAIEGDSDALTRLATCFRSPEPAAMADQSSTAI